MDADKLTSHTGWDTGLCQDYCRALSLWFASRVDARWVVRQWHLKKVAATP